MQSFRDGFYRPSIIKCPERQTLRSFRNGFDRPVIDWIKRYALYFDGVNDYVTFSGPVIPAGAKQIIFDISKTNVPGTQQAIFATNQFGTLNHGDDCRINTSGQIVWNNTKASPGDSRFFLTGSTNICDGDNHIVELTWDGTTNTNAVQILIDGMLDGSSTADSTESVQGSYNLTIGRSGAATAYYLSNAELSEFLIFQGTKAEAKYLFKEGTGSILHDVRGIYPGTITGATWVTI